MEAGQGPAQSGCIGQLTSPPHLGLFLHPKYIIGMHLTVVGRPPHWFLDRWGKRCFFKEGQEEVSKTSSPTWQTRQQTTKTAATQGGEMAEVIASLSYPRTIR